MVRAAHIVALLLSTSSLLLCVGASNMWELDDLDEPSYRSHSENKRSHFEKRIFDCKKENQNCYGFPRCCGDLSCYWQDGYSPFRPGTCVMCIEKGLACQRNSACCAGMMCDKNDLLNINGVCNTPRTSGTCYRNSQCLYHCEKPYYKGQGHCVSAPSTPSG